MGGAVVSREDAFWRKWPVVPVSAMAVDGKGGMRVLTRRQSILESAVCTLLPDCQVVLGLLASLPPMVFARVALF